MTIALFVATGLGLAAVALYTLILGPPRRQWVRVSLMTGLAVVASLGVWRAAVDAERIEPVWMNVATGTKPLPIPIRVRMAPDLDGYVEAARAAIHMWNQQAGCRIFIEQPAESYTYDVRILFLKNEPCDGVSSDPDKSVAASAYFCGSGAVDIDIQRLDEIQAAYVVFAHELGHVLGLAHDPSGLMAPRIEEMTLVLPSAKDARAVRQRYCEAQ